ncbi:MAG: DUF1501 domain-containing protein [Planctomycetota bacterium]|nr:DUF1501 domain-containing protein [Planctomycetota bacterium]
MKNNSHKFCRTTRREFLWQAGCGFFGSALTYMLDKDGFFIPKAEAASPISPFDVKPSHFPLRAKRCIFLFMVGGPSQMDTFDPKPELNKLHGTEHDFGQLNSISQKPKGTLKGSPFKFSKHGQSGTEVSELFPNVAEHVDDMAILKSVLADSAAHGAASLQMNTGYIRQGFPSVGSWAMYGLGCETQNLPGFVVLVNGAPYSGAQNWSSGFMPSAYQGVVFNGNGVPIRNLNPASRASAEDQRRQLDLLNKFNGMHQESCPMNTELYARINSYELAFRMQSHAPEAVNLKTEDAKTKALYGVEEPDTDAFGRSCLLSRRLVERGVRFVQIFHSNWDTHGDNDNRHRTLCRQTDKPIAGLLSDLKQRGLLDETLVIWGGEFGRTPIGGTNDKGGRDHHAAGFTMWMAGGGIKGGLAYGKTDDLGFHAIEGKVHLHDLHATVLHQMGVNHEKLTFFHAGRNHRLTDVHGNVVKEILA